MAKPANWPNTLTKLANRAMARIGCTYRFTDLETDEHEYADTVNELIYDVIRETQSDFRWPELQTLSIITTPDATYADTTGRPWAYRFALPDDFIRPLDENLYAYEISGAFVYTNQSESLPFHYIRYEEDVSLWSAMLTRCITHRLAMTISLPITTTDAIAGGLMAEYNQIIEPDSHRVASYNQKSKRRRSSGVGRYAGLRGGEQGTGGFIR